jgi:xanthine/CO dehydrogenase XdhC/CoxF family maturation factor
MLFAATGERCGLLSGGCLEGDLQDHALALLASDNQRTVVRHYDSRGSDDAIWGLGLGCEGAMQVLLLRLDSSNRYQPLSGLFEADDAQRLSAFDIDIQSGAVTKSVSFTTELVGTTFRIVSSKTVRLLVCGAGPDVEPVEKLATLIGWRVTIVDHRPAYIQSQRFDDRTRLVLSDRFDLAPIIGTETFDAAVVMSHHLIADEHYLKALAAIDIPYIGLLGPLTRRQRLFASLGPISKKLIPRLRAPVGLDLGGRTPEEIALSIVAEIQAALNGRHGAPFSSGR